MKRFAYLCIGLFISINTFADCSHINCEFMPRINPPIESHFNFPAGYEMTSANVKSSYSWGSNLSLTNQSTELCCNDADQFFSIISTDHKRRCTIDSGVDYNAQNISATERNDLGPDNNMSCKISGGQVKNHQYLYQVTIN